MKILRPTLAFLGTAAVRFAGMTAYRSFQTAPPPPDPASASAPAIPSAPSRLTPDTAVDDPLPGSPDNPATADQWRALLTTFELPPEWAEVLAAPDPANFPEWSAKLHNLPDNPSRNILEELFYGRWASMDPHGATAFLITGNNKTGLSALFSQWVLLDHSAALTAASTAGKDYLHAALCSLAVNNPDKVFQWTAAHPGSNLFQFSGRGSESNLTALRCLMAADPAKVLGWIHQIPPADWGVATASTVARVMAKTNPDQALKWAKSITDPKRSKEAQMAVANVLADTLPEKALDLYSQIPNREEDVLFGDCLELFGKVGGVAPGKILEVANSMRDDALRGTLITNMMGELLMKNPTQAFALADSMGLAALAGSTYGSPKELETVDQARQVLEAAQSGPTSVFRGRSATTAISVMLEQDQKGLAQFLEGKMDTPFFARLDLQESIAATGRTLDPDLARVLNIRPEHELAVQVSRDPAAAAATLERITDPAARVASVEKIAEKWSAQDQGDAVAWATTLTNPGDQEAAWKTIAGKWLEDDPQQASAWVKGLPPGSPRDATVAVLVNQISNKDPDLAWQWAGTMTDPSQKIRALGNAAQAWQKTDPAALHTALEATPMQPAERVAILQQIKQAP